MGYHRLFSVMAVLLLLALCLSACGSAGWEVTITDVYTATKLDSVGGAFTLTEVGMIFLVVEYSVDFNGPPQDESEFALYGIAITEEDETLLPDVFGFGMGDTLIYATVDEGEAIMLKPEVVAESPWKTSLAFIIPEVDASQVYKIQFLSLPDVTFPVKAKQ